MKKGEKYGNRNEAVNFAQHDAQVTRFDLEAGGDFFRAEQSPWRALRMEAH